MVNVLGDNAAIVSGLCLVAAIFLYYTVSPWNFIGKFRFDGGEAGFAQVASRAESEMQNSGANLDRNSRLSRLCDAAPVSQGSRAGDPDQ